ncbi:hypothetical protein HKD37_19G052736 [Glycine soja]
MPFILSYKSGTMTHPYESLFIIRETAASSSSSLLHNAFSSSSTLLLLPAASSSTSTLSLVLLRLLPMVVATSSSPVFFLLHHRLRELTIEEHGEWSEMAKMMQNVAVPPVTILNTVHAKDQIYDEVNLDQPAIVAGWTILRDFYQLTEDHLVSLTHYVSNSVTFKVYLTQQKVTYSSLDIPSSMYYFLEDKGWTHLHLEDVAECRLVFNHWRETLKIGVRWKHFCETLSLTANMKIIFEFIDSTVNRLLFWPCL